MGKLFRCTFKHLSVRHAPKMRVFLAALLLIQSAPMNSMAIEIVAHRGSSAEAPENTVAAAKLAWEQKADAVEFDIRQTRDDRLIVIHDKDVRRTVGTRGLVSALTLEELRKLDAGSWKSSAYRGERLPTLEEMLATGEGRGRLFIEIKGGPEMVPELKTCLQRAKTRPERAVIIAFDRATAAKAKRELPENKVLWLVDYKRENIIGRYPDLDKILQFAREAKLDGLDISAKWPIDADFVRKVKAAGLELHVWTVDDAALARRLVKAGVDGITTNRPGWMREQLAN